MAAYKRLDVLNAMISTGVIPVFYHGDFEVARGIIKACADGGARCVEFTNRGDQAHLVFTDLVRYAAKECPQLILGVGSVLDAPTTALYIQCGANFVVGPVLNPEVARLCNRRKVAYCPGCGTASEISQAEELGCEIIKIFPGEQIGGPAFVKAMLAPCPWTNLMPTGGVDATRESLTAWFKAGIACAGMGSNLITRELIAARDFDAIARNVRQTIEWVAQIRTNL